MEMEALVGRVKSLSQCLHFFDFFFSYGGL